MLDKLYLTAAIIAGSSLVVMTLLMLSQIVGRWFDIIVPSTEDFSGFLLAAATFMALPYALRSGSHIRVSLFLTLMPTSLRKIIEFFVLLMVIVVMAYVTWSVTLMVIETWQFEELTQGYVAIPLWIPQLPMAIGLLLFLIALMDDFVALITTGSTSYLRHESDNEH